MQNEYKIYQVINKPYTKEKNRNVDIEKKNLSKFRNLYETKDIILR